MLAVLVVLVPAAEARGRACSAGLIALTFDDGPSRTQTPRLVRLLKDRNVPATFFMVGERVQSAPRVARMVARRGFQIANHTWSHPMLNRLGDHAVRLQLRSTRRELRTGRLHAGALMRPPYGAINARVDAVVRALGLTPVLWNVDSRDWAGGGPRQIADRILAQLRPHKSNIVLQHDGVTNSPASVGAVPLVIRDARRRGYCFTGLGPDGRMIPRHVASRALPRVPPVIQAAPPPPGTSEPVLRFGALDPWFGQRDRTTR